MKTYKTKIAALIVGLIVSGSMFISCHKSPASWDAQVLAPVVNANLSINDLLTSNYIKNNNDSSVSLVYTDSLYNLNVDTILTIPDTLIPYNELWIGGSYTVTPGSEIFGTEQTTPYHTGSVELTEGILQSGFLTFTVRNPLPQPVDYTYKVLNMINAQNNSDTLNVVVTIPANSSLTRQVPLAGYKIDFTGPAHNGYNELSTRIQIYLDPSAGSLVLSPANDTLASANVSFLNVIPYYAKGYFGTTTKTFGPQSVSFPVFNNIIAGKLNLQNVSVNLTLKNGFGIDASLLLSSLYSYSKLTKDTVYLNAPGVGVVGTTIHVNRATQTNNPSSPVTPSVLNFAINPSNSNILNWLDNMPTAIGYKLSVITDPLGNVSGSNDFAYYGYGINANINITIPLSLIAQNLTLADTLAVNFGGSGGAAQHVKSGSLTIYANNGFPFSAGLQLYLLNNNNMVYDSVFIPSQTIAAAPVNANTGIVIAPRSSVLTASLNAAQTQELFNTKRVVLYARFNMGTPPATYEKIYDYYQLGVKLVGNFDYQIN